VGHFEYYGGLGASSALSAGPDVGCRGQRMTSNLRKLGVGSAPAGWGARHAGACRVGARLARNALVMRGLNERADRTLGRVHVVEPVVGADRLGVCRGPSAVA
jgi:hypothetical protein